MTNKTKGLAAAATVAVAAVTTVMVTRDSKPEPYVFNGFAEASQQATAVLKSGTNQFELLFEFNPDRLDEQNNHPGVVLVFLNGERIGTNIVTGFHRNMKPDELRRLAETALVSEGR